MRTVIHCFCALLVLVISGCSRSSIATEESKERNSSLYRRARSAEQSGEVKEAIRLYRTLLVEEPRAYSVHFQLAALLQDSEEDYISALYHYKQYLALRPETEKANLVQDRIRVTEQLLAPQLLRKLGTSAQALSQAHLLKENDRLKEQLTKLEGEKSVLSEEKDRAEKTAMASQAELERLRELLNKMRAVDRAEKSAESAATIAERERAAATNKTRDGKSLRELRLEAEKEAADAANKTGTGTTDDVMNKVKQKLGDAPAEPETGTHKKPRPEPKSYTVQAGDSLFKISEKFYGDSTQWKKIREANRATINPDGRLRIGQTLVIP
jgi:nucleoid-associated protein YgaU